ncbi:MAG TPA: HAD-IIA family hydrolase [Solirubrobacteraceae bacterium]|nr:HAD-IIA family hydrolase [Solirubrobacteraceae bacterium]
MPVSPLISAYDQVILDLDGTVWVGGVATPRAPEAIAAIRESGKRLVFVTNDGGRSPEEYVQKLWSIGCTAAVEEVVSVGSAIQYVLAERKPGANVYVIGGPPIFRHVADAGHHIANNTSHAETADVVVAVAHIEFNYAEMVTATRALLAGAEFISGGRDRNYPAAGGIAPGTGAVTAALEYATGVTAHAVGKPDPQVFEVALDRLGPGRTLMIGDHLVSDLGGAAAAGIDAAVVLTGVTSRAEAEAASDPAPVAIGQDLATLVLSTQWPLTQIRS